MANDRYARKSVGDADHEAVTVKLWKKALRLKRDIRGCIAGEYTGIANKGSLFY